LFALAQQLCAELPLFPAPLSKAARGSLLLDGRGLTHHKIPAPPAGSTTLDKAFAVLLQDSLDHISHHLPSNCDPFTADDLHQVRVGLRHMLALLSMFKPWLRKAWYQANKNGAHQHLQALANARDHYILLNETCMAVHQSTQQKPLRAQLKTQADKTFTAAKEYLLGQTFATWLLDCSLSLHTHSLVSKRAKALQWSDIAPSLLRKKLKAYAKVLQQVQHGTLALHSLRIQTKYLRYQYALLGNKPTALLKQLGELQDALGEISDLNSAGAILLPLAKSQRNLVPAITALGGWHLSRHPQRLHALSEQKRKLCKTLKHVQRKAK
jgi:CHAD domain-containing protein